MKPKFLLLLIWFYPISTKIFSQCTPSMAEECILANVFCSLDELNGYSCNNSSTVPSQCSPLCSQGGVGNNTSWWGFVTEGGNVTITLTVGTCNNSQGLEFGIWGNCFCQEEIACHTMPCAPSGSVNTLSTTLTACKTYYLWVDGCNGDLCNFTITTSGGGTPTLSPLGKINNKSNMIIDVCKGACSVKFFVNPESGACKPTYEWTLDGNEVGGNSNEVLLDMPDEGDFQICVTAYIGNPLSGSICSQQGPQCAIIKVRSLPDKFGPSRILCKEQTIPGGYKWHSQRIFSSGIYRGQFEEANCCRFDSVVEFIVLDPPIPENVYYISCDKNPYIDITGKKHFPCLNKSRIVLPKTTNPYRCDSSILLTAIDVDFGPTWSMHCIGGMIELIPNINIIKPCSVGESYEFDYNWYKKSEPTKIISTDERLLVSSVSEDYCLQVTVRTQFLDKIEVCSKIFCESINEGTLSPDCSFKLEGNKVYCFDLIGDYWVDQLIPKNVNFYSWTIQGGTFISRTDTSDVKALWSLSANDTGKVCVSYTNDCGTSCEKCKKVILDTKIAGNDFEKRGLSAYLDAKPNPNGIWRLISGPHQVIISEPNNPRTKITAFNYGYYCFEWTINDTNCQIKDTLCVNLHSFKKASPEYPSKIFDERAGLKSVKDQITSMIFTPSLIENSGESFIALNRNQNAKINYNWINMYGRVICQGDLNIIQGIYKLNIHAPNQEGLFILAIEINGVTTINKVCVFE